MASCSGKPNEVKKHASISALWTVASPYIMDLYVHECNDSTSAWLNNWDTLNKARQHNNANWDSPLSLLFKEKVSCPRWDSNPRHCFSRPVLCPLSYQGSSWLEHRWFAVNHIHSILFHPHSVHHTRTYSIAIHAWNQTTRWPGMTFCSENPRKWCSNTSFLDCGLTVHKCT